MKLAIQEDMLAGRSLLEKFERAAALGFDGIEFWARDITRQMDEAVPALERAGLVAAGVNFGRQADLLDASVIERDTALEQLRQAIMDASDIGSVGVSFVPHFFGPTVPDLSPLMDADQVQSELLNAHLRTLEDYANAMGVSLYIEPLNRYETSFLNRLDQASVIARRRAHPRIRITADVFHMALEEDDLAAAITANADTIGYVHLADHNRRLPGLGFLPFARVAAALRQIGYDGWAALECDEPGDNAKRADAYALHLPACVAFLREAGF